MKSTLLRSAAAGALLLGSAGAAFAVTADFDVIVEIQSLLSVTKNADQNWDVITSGTVPSVITLTTAGACSETGGGDASIATAANCTAAEFAITGPASANITITYLTSTTGLGGITGLDLTLVDNSTAGVIGLDGAGLGTLLIGGELAVPAGIALPAAVVPVTVDFNF